MLSGITALHAADPAQQPIANTPAPDTVDIRTVFQAVDWKSRSVRRYAKKINRVLNFKSELFPAGDPKPDSEESAAIAALIRKLDCEEFADRQTASERLLVFGPVALEQLLAAASTTKDPEIQDRCKALADAAIDALEADRTRWTAMMEFRQGRVLTEPQLICLDGEEATIQVGELVRYAETFVASTEGCGVKFVKDDSDDDNDE